MNDDFDWTAYYRDTRRLSLDARGAWMDCLCEMRERRTKGRLSEPLSVYATIFGTTTRKAQRVINEIVAREVADYVPEANGNLTLINRRMFRKFGQTCADSGAEMRPNLAPSAASQGPKARETLGESDIGAKNGSNGHKPPSYEEEEITKPVSPKRKKGVQGERIPDPFPLTAEMVEWAIANCPGLRVEEAHEGFIEYWTNNTTAKAYKVNWLLTWRKGMKFALKWQKDRDAKLSIGKHEDDWTEPVCWRCNDSLVITAQKPGAQFDWEVDLVPCPECQTVSV